jgi:hypothetical protein
LAAKQTRILLGCYRKGEAADPEVYVTSVATVLANYPEDVVMIVTDPVRGIPGRVNWLPTVAEVRLACEAEMKPHYDEIARRKRVTDTARVLAAPEPPTAEQRARAVEHWETSVRPTMGFTEVPPPKETPQEALARLKTEGLGPVIVIGHGLAAKFEQMKARN